MAYLWRSRILALAVVSLSVFLLCSSALASQQPDWATLSKALKSSAVLTVETKEGEKRTGLVFLAFREGLAVTALDSLRTARKVTLRFSDGGEYQSTGLVDREGKHGIALIGVPHSGRTVLKLSTTKLSPGTAVQCAAAKDDSFGFVQLTVAEIHQGPAGVERYILAGEIPPGNSGAPVFDLKGQVLGVLVENHKSGNLRHVLVPASCIRALNSSLPVSSWSETKGSSGGNSSSPQSTASAFSALDKSLADFLTLFVDNNTIRNWANYKSNGQGYRNGVPQKVYDYQAKFGMALRNLKTITTDNPLRQKVIKTALEAGNSGYAATEYWIKGILMGQTAGSWTAQADDMVKRSNAASNLSHEILRAIDSGLAELYESDETFKAALPPEMAYCLALLPRPSKFRLGVSSLSTVPLYLNAVYDNSFASQLGLMENDRIISVDAKGLAPQNVEDFKLIIQNSLGRTLKVIVARGGKRVQIEMNIPQTIPPQHLY